MSQARISRLTIDIPLSEHKRIKTLASLMGTTMKDLVLMSVEDFVSRKLNKVTEKTLKLSEKGRGLKRFDTLNELFEDLEI